ncbi:hypothetical protein AXI64_gp226 [Vibrio phage qdvp001]|uniref:hypothetical protein n=1 Tax=Vibrio phage qdvp001 TaxID=1003177 RepID=UPI0007214356|nr:hypothetical protein AXI64_gp226 [Vibrio phage qdvp001]ALM62218.1 hypothetical protein qdvp001_226 [Vibrio phage qdvp001]
MKLNKAQQKRIKRAVRLSEWSCRQRKASVSDNSKTAHSGIRAVIWRGYQWMDIYYYSWADCYQHDNPIIALDRDCKQEVLTDWDVEQLGMKRFVM